MTFGTRAALPAENGNGSVRLLRQAVNAAALLSVLQLIFYVLDSLLYTPVEAAVWDLFGTDPEAYNAILDVYEMFVYALGFLLPLFLTLLICRGRAYRPDIPFSMSLPPHPAAAIFVTVGFLYAFSSVSDRILSLLEAIGVPIAWYDTPLPDTPGRILLYFVSSVILPAVVEELIFRGYILHLLLPFGKTFAILVSAVLFGVMHLYLPQLLYASVAGVLIGYFVVKGSSLWIGILIHLFNNLMSFLSDMAYLFLSEDGYLLFSVIQQGILYIAALVSLLILFRGNAEDTGSGYVLESGAVYNRLMTTEDAFHSFLTLPLLLYFVGAAYFIVMNSFLF